MKRVMKISLFTVSLALLLVQCGTSKNSGKKCDGRKATRTPMGNM